MHRAVEFAPHLVQGSSWAVPGVCWFFNQFWRTMLNMGPGGGNEFSNINDFKEQNKLLKASNPSVWGALQGLVCTPWTGTPSLSHIAPASPWTLQGCGSHSSLGIPSPPHTEEIPPNFPSKPTLLQFKTFPSLCCHSIPYK